MNFSGCVENLLPAHNNYTSTHSTILVGNIAASVVSAFICCTFLVLRAASNQKGVKAWYTFNTMEHDVNLAVNADHPLSNVAIVGSLLLLMTMMMMTLFRCLIWRLI